MLDRELMILHVASPNLLRWRHGSSAKLVFFSNCFQCYAANEIARGCSKRLLRYYNLALMEQTVRLPVPDRMNISIVLLCEAKFNSYTFSVNGRIQKLTFCSET